MWESTRPICPRMSCTSCRISCRSSWISCRNVLPQFPGRLPHFLNLLPRLLAGRSHLVAQVLDLFPCLVPHVPHLVPQPSTAGPKSVRPSRYPPPPPQPGRLSVRHSFFLLRRHPRHGGSELRRTGSEQETCPTVRSILPLTAGGCQLPFSRTTSRRNLRSNEVLLGSWPGSSWLGGRV